MIETNSDPKNIASQHVLIKLGFRYIVMIWCKATEQDEPYYEIIIK